MSKEYYLIVRYNEDNSIEDIDGILYGTKYKVDKALKGQVQEWNKLYPLNKNKFRANIQPCYKV